jgi:cell division protein FtsL
MSPAQAAARADAAPAKRAPRRPALRTAQAPVSRWARVSATLRQGNLLGRIGTLTAAALFVGVFGVVVFQALLVQGQARLDHVNGEIATQQQQAKQLHLQVAQLDSPERIVTYARNNLHMVDPGDVVYLQQAPGDDAKAATATTVAPAPTTPTTARPTTPTTAVRPTTPTTASKVTGPPATSAVSRRP